MRWAIVVFLGLLVVGLGLNRSTSDPPRTVEGTFLELLGSVQQDEGDSARIQIGRDICAELRNGESPFAATKHFVGASDRNAVHLQAGAFLAAATADGSLCPDQRHKLDEWIERGSPSQVGGLRE